jgi:hypothetical protein
MSIEGFTRNRRHQFGRQVAFGTVVAATRAYSAKGTPSVDLKWTDPEVDTGSIDPVVAPTREAPDLGASLNFPSLHYNDLPLIMCGIFGGGETPAGAGTAKTWTHKPDPAAPEDPDPFSYEFGDDVTSDWYQFGDGHEDSVEITGPDGLGPLSATTAWKFGSVASTGSTDQPVTGSVPTALSVAQNEAIVYLKDLSVYLAATVAGLGAGQLSDTVHSFVLRITQAWDEKRWANGDQSFDIDALGRGARAIEVELTCSKNSKTVGTGSLSDDWLSEGVHDAYLRLKAVSKVVAQSGPPPVPYSWQVTLPVRVYTRTDGESGGNSTVVLTAHAYYEPSTFDGVFESVAVTTIADDDLGA